MSFDTFTQAGASAAAIFAIKSAVVAVLQVRERCNSSTLSNPEDANNFLGFLFPVLGAGPSFGGPVMIERQQRITHNNVANEPIFLALVVAAIAAGVEPANGATAIQVYVGSRVLHNVVYLFGSKVNSGLRTGCYLTGLGAMLYLATSTLLSL